MELSTTEAISVGMLDRFRNVSIVSKNENISQLILPQTYVAIIGLSSLVFDNYLDGFYEKRFLQPSQFSSTAGSEEEQREHLKFSSLKAEKTDNNASFLLDEANAVIMPSLFSEEALEGKNTRRSVSFFHGATVLVEEGSRKVVVDVQSRFF